MNQNPFIVKLKKEQRTNESFIQIENENIQNQITRNITVPRQEFGIEKMNKIGEERRIESKEIIVNELENDKEKNAFKNLENGTSVNNQEGEIRLVG